MITDIFNLCDIVRQTGFELHAWLRGGHLEKVYENGLVHRLSKLGVSVRAQYPLTVFDEDGTVLGNYCADVFVEDRLIVEIKACKAIAEDHVAQLLGYMRAAHVEHGLLLNLGAVKFQAKKFIMSPRGRPAEAEEDSSHS